MSRLSSDESNIAVGQRLMAIRSAASLTQNDFATSLGLSPRAYANYERGEREMPVALFRQLYTIYRVDPLWVLFGPGNEPMFADLRRIDAELLMQVIELIEESLHKAGKRLRPEKKARVIQLAYEHCAEKGAVDLTRVREMVRLAA